MNAICKIRAKIFYPLSSSTPIYLLRGGINKSSSICLISPEKNPKPYPWEPCLSLYRSNITLNRSVRPA